MKSGGLTSRKSRIDEVGAMFRFITPALISLVLFILGLIINNQAKLDEKILCIQKEQYAYFNNHLSNYKDFGIMVEHRLTKIEAILGTIKKRNEH